VVPSVTVSPGFDPRSGSSGSTALVPEFEVVRPVKVNSRRRRSAEERHQGKPDEPPVWRDHRLHAERRAFAEDHDHRLLCRGEVTHDRNHARYERSLRRIGDERLLTVEQVTLGACITLVRLSPCAAWIRKNASMSLRIAKPKLAAVAASNPPNCRQSRPEAVLRVLQVEIDGRCRRGRTRL
jgi:hypothetical protein